MKYCSECGNTVQLSIPIGDDRERHVCGSCNTIHYQNPRIITGCLPIYEDKVLLCKRAIKPRYGLWTLPAGFMENGETTAEGALREAWEEANAVLENEELYTLFSLPYINQVYFFYRARLPKLEFGPSFESLEVKLFAEEEIPWQELAFSVVKRTLQHYFNDRPNNHFPLRAEDIVRRPE